ncbi:MAG TPA: sensor histidine kinase [Chitinophagales bacterium]|nr:sensor histidine kinase [Chitinophagales bacterium]
MLWLMWWASNLTQAQDQAVADSIAAQKAVDYYLGKGNEAYRTKASLKSFEISNMYFDSAYQVALKANDKKLLLRATIAKGQVYDAWNKAPQKTIEYYTEAYRLSKEVKIKPYYRLYLKHHVAHAYDKIADTLNCTRVLEELLTDASLLDTMLRVKIELMPRMALIATQVGNYALAQKILDRIGKNTIYIKNSPDSYNYKDHYFLTKARIDAYHFRKKQSVYLDSLQLMLAHVGNVSDSLYYIGQLKQLYDQLEQYPQAYNYSQLEFKLSNRLNNQAGVASLENQLLASELALTQRKQELEEVKQQNKTRLLWLMGVSVLVVSGFSVRLFRRNKVIAQQTHELSILNQDLSLKNKQNELLQKEIHHRTKNNLQMIFSILQMQERTVESEEAQKHLQEARFRIESIAGLHEQLMNNNNIIDFNKYITRLVNTIMSGIVGTKAQNTQTHLEVEDVYVPTNSILPLALIINEWMTNTLKYAKPPSDELEIYVKIYQTNQQLFIHYKDNGIPAQNYVPGFGSYIADLLCKQINAQLSRNPNNSFDYQLQLTV